MISPPAVRYKAMGVQFLWTDIGQWVQAAAVDYLAAVGAPAKAAANAKL
jgi:hypothetical protein